MTIEEKATNYAEERCGRLDYATGQLAYKRGATDQQKIDKELFIELIYNLMEIGDIEVHDIDKVIGFINKKMEE